MSLVKISGNASGTGTFEIAAPNSNTDRTLTLPDASGTVVVGASAVSAVGQIPFSTDGTSYTPTEKIVSGTVVASTSGASIDFTSIPSWVKRITVMFNGVSLSGTSTIQIQLGTSGGVQATGYNSNSTQLTNALAVSLIASTTGFVINSASASAAHSGQYVLSLLDSSNGLWVLTGAVGIDGSATMMINTGKKTLSGTLDRVRITTVNGTDTFDAGSINILYE